MKVVKMFIPSELGLTAEEETTLGEIAGGSSDCCYFWLRVDINYDVEPDFNPMDEIEFYLSNKLVSKGLAKPGENVMIDLRW